MGCGCIGGCGSGAATDEVAGGSSPEMPRVEDGIHEAAAEVDGEESEEEEDEEDDG